MQEKFIDYILGWQERDYSFKVNLRRRCGVHEGALDEGDPWLHERMAAELRSSAFDFSAYLAFTLEGAVSDAIEVHSFSWLVVWLYLLISFPLHRYLLHVTMPQVAILVLTLPSLAWFALCLFLFKQQQTDIYMRLEKVRRKSATTPEFDRTMEASFSSVAFRLLRGRRLMRIAQVLCILSSYCLGRLMFDPPDWMEDIGMTLASTVIVLSSWVIMMAWLVFQAPVFLALMSLPPYLSLEEQKDMHIFWSAFKPEHGIKLESLSDRLERARHTRDEPAYARPSKMPAQSRDENPPESIDT
jgi:hypothetical protein